MSKRIPEEKKKEVQRLYEKGISMKDIAGRTGISYYSVYGLTRLRQRTNPETKKPYRSRGEYDDYQARQRTNPETDKSYRSKSEYDDYLARQRTNPETDMLFESLREYLDFRARQRTNPETNRPFKSSRELRDYNARQRSQKERNRELSDFVKRRLKWIGLNQNWLAEKIGVSRQAVSLYVAGKSIPKGENLRNLLLALDIKKSTKLPKSLKNLVNEKL